MMVNNWNNNGIIYIYIYLSIYPGKFDHDLTVLPNPGIMVYFREIIPKWPYFRFVKYSNLHIIYIYNRIIII